MADMILSPIAGLIVETLGSAAVQEIKSLWGVRDDLEALEGTLSTIRAVLVDAEKRQIREEQVKDWLKKLEDVLYDADDLVDEVNFEGLRRQLMHGKEILKKVRTFFSSDNQLVFQRKIAGEIKAIRERLDAISADKDRFRLEVRQEITQPERNMRETGAFVDEENVVGRESEKTEILKRLMSLEVHTGASGSSTRREKVCVIPIVGMGGLGKTTLAQLVYNAKEVEKHFNLRLWVCVSDNVDKNPLIEKVVGSITNMNTKNLEMPKLEKTIREKINGKRFLIVLDDVWNQEIGQEWERLKGLLGKYCVEGSRIIVTTRDDMVAKVMGGMQSCRLGRLDLDDSWDLFRKKAFEHGQEPTNPTIVDTAKAILEKCGGVPLAISMIGRMLCFRDAVTEWPSFLQKELSNIPQDENGILSTLKLSFDFLPSHLKACFAYCSLFPKDHEIDVHTLITHWVAQGFIRSDQSHNLEEIGYEHFKDLLWRSFFQEAKKDELLNMVTTCKMHDLVHDLAIHVAGEKYATVASCQGSNQRKSIRHISFDSNSLTRLEEVPSSWLQLQRIRSFHLQPTYYGTIFERGSICNEIISNIKLVRILHMRCAGIKTVPDSIGNLKHLRHLDLSFNYDIKTLPACITKLVNLQTLKLNWCMALCELPSGIEELVNLRHLELESCDRLTHMPKGLSKLTNLQTLSLVVLSENVPNRPCSKLDELMELNNLRGELTIKGIRSGMVTAATKLRENTHLRSLCLNFERGDDDETKWETTLEGLQPHPNLRELTLVRYGGTSLSGFLPTLTNLVKLRLEDCSKCQQLPSLGKFHSLKEMSLKKLPSLKYISINEGDFYFSTSSSASVSVLPSLEKLGLIDLPKFRGWRRSGMMENQVEQLLLPSFPRLSSLTISGCEQLTFMPLYTNIDKELILESVSWKSYEHTLTAEEASSSSLSTIPTIVSVSSSPVSKLTYLQISSIMDLQCFPDERMEGLASLKKLHILDCHGLKNLSPSIQHLTSIETLEIGNCEEFEGFEWPENPALTSLSRLNLFGLPKLKHLSSPGKQHLTSLESLRICNCKEFEWSALTSLRQLTLIGVPKLKHLSSSGIQNLTSLEELEISNCEEFEGFEWPETPALTSLRLLKLSGLPKLKHLSSPGIQNLTSLEKLEISYCDEFEGFEWPETPALTSLRLLKLSGLPKLKHLSSPGIQHLISLEELATDCCTEFQVSNDDAIEWRALTTLRSLSFWRLPQLVTLPGGLQFLTTLNKLQIGECDNFTALPDWICKLSSLQSIKIYECLNLKSVPASISSLTSLQKLEINGEDMNPKRNT